MKMYNISYQFGKSEYVEICENKKEVAEIVEIVLSRGVEKIMIEKKEKDNSQLKKAEG